MAVGSYPIAVNPVTGAVYYDSVGSTIPTADGATASAGTSLLAAPADHVHGRPTWSPSDYAYLAWTFDPLTQNNVAAVGTAGTLMLNRIHVPTAISATNLVMYSGTAGSSLTSGQCFAGIWTAAGVKVGVTADQAVAWGTTGVKSMALAGGPFTLSAGDHYLGYWFNGSAGPGFLRQTTANNPLSMNLALAAPNFRVCTADTGLTTTAPAPLGAQTIGNIYFWCAIS